VLIRILISGAGIAGPVPAYWLTRHDFSATVLKRAPTLRKTGGHAVDLFRPATNISEKTERPPPVKITRQIVSRLRKRFQQPV
jgi:2-polyprenyl-6-methoxyphenol hydroxylase-like FAD-dependent oxidoreductase